MQTIELPKIPAAIECLDLRDLENGRLYNEAESGTIIKALKGHVTPYRYSKEEVGFFLQPENPKKAPFGIFHDADGEVYAIYKGSKHHKELGEGAFGKVKYAQNIRTGEWVVLKVQEVGEEEKKIELAEQEKRNISDITNNKKSAAVTRTSKKSGENKIAFVMPYAGDKNLETFCWKKQATLTATTALTIAYQLAIDLQAMHQKNILHRDIKLANAVIDIDNNTIRFIDFGFACQMPEGTKTFEGTHRGTPNYMAPEILSKEYAKYFRGIFTIAQFGTAKTRTEKAKTRKENDRTFYNYTPQTDIYAFGILLQKLFGMRKTVFKNKEKEFEYSLPKSFEKSPSLEKILKDMTSGKPEERPSIETILETLEIAQKEMGYSPPSEPCLINVESVIDILGNKEELKKYKNQDIIYLTATENKDNTTDWIEKAQKLKAKGLPISSLMLIGSPEECHEKAFQLNQERLYTGRSPTLT